MKTIKTNRHNAGVWHVRDLKAWPEVARNPQRFIKVTVMNKMKNQII
jgi:hypothetical protein